MDYYILTRKGSPASDTAVFFAGRDGDERTAAVFTAREQALRFGAGWSDTDEVRRVNEIDLLDWLIHLYRRGIQRIAVDPDRHSAQAMRRPTYSLWLMLADLTGALSERLNALSAPAETDFNRIVTYCCRHCGKVRRQLPCQRTPSCCGLDMVAADDDHSTGLVSPRQHAAAEDQSASRHE